MSMTPAAGATRPSLREDVLLARPAMDRHALWEHCKNSLGIARLLAQEGRAAELVETACYLAVDSACRAALFSAHRAYDGDPAHALHRLAAPRGLWPVDGTAQERLRAAEAAVGWLAGFLRSEAPEHRWGY